MSLQNISLSLSVRAPIEQVFEVFADHNQFAKLFGGHSVRIKSGEQDENGVGSMRAIGPWPLTFQEKVLAYEENKLIDYAVCKGSPLKDHLGQIRFTQDKELVKIDYEMQFRSKIPFLGGLFKRVLGKALETNANKILLGLQENYSVA